MDRSRVGAAAGTPPILSPLAEQHERLLGRDRLGQEHLDKVPDKSTDKNPQM